MILSTTPKRPGALPKGVGTERPPMLDRGRWAASIVKRPVRWLWEPFIQQGAINLITGDPKTGKSTIVCEIAARLSRGEPLPGQGQAAPPLRVWLLNGEDCAEDTIVWRLEKQGADLNRVLVTDMGETLNARAVAEMGQEAANKGIDVAIIDPLQAWIGGEMDLHRANEVRAWFVPFRNLALTTGITFIFVRHRRKGGPEDGSTLQGGLGSIDISGIARSELSTFRKKGENTNVLYRLGGNVGLSGTGWRYRIDGQGTIGDHGTLVWAEPYVEGSKSAPNKVPKAFGAALELIRNALKDGPKPAHEVHKAAAAAKITATTLGRARDQLCTFYKQDGIQMWRIQEDSNDEIA